MLYDDDFLKKLDEHHEKTTYARIISLDLEENPIEQVEGKITAGSVNVDGASAVRRTCSLTMVSNDININDYYWGLNTKFKLEVGVENKVDSSYPDIIWFKMGTYVITSFNLSISTNSAQISLQGKDKMCLLNGDVGGVINASTDFGTYDFYDTETGITTNYKLPIKQILWDAVHTYANEPFHNIVLNDLDELGLELLEYQYDVPLYLIRSADSDEYLYPIIGTITVYPIDRVGSCDISEINFDQLTTSMLGNVVEPTKFKLENATNAQIYQAAKVEYGQTAGYHTCDLVYAGDLIANVGETVTSVFDKIKNMLGQFEYFYNLDGQFVFQRQKSLVNTVWTPQKRDGDNELYVESLALASNSIYNFKGNILLASVQNQPNLLNLRNDYTVWGVRKALSGSEIPIHMRYAIDNKPKRYVDMNGKVWTTLSAEEVQAENDNKSTISYVASLLNKMENFERDSSLYPDGLKVDDGDGNLIVPKDCLYWRLGEWAEYYKILFNEYPGNLQPQHFMNYICNSYGNFKTFIDQWPGCAMSSTIRFIKEEKYKVTSISNAKVVEIFYFHKNPEDPDEVSYAYDYHGSCVHTYGQWLAPMQYVNGGEYNGVYYAPFDDNYPWDLLSENARGERLPADGYNYKNFLLALRDQLGLFHIEIYCYDPQIPEDLREARLKEIEETIEYIDPHAAEDYRYEMDWRELIYRMAIDYRRYNHNDDFEIQIAKNNSPYYPRGVTGYEQYYTDMEGFWRQLYYPAFSADERKKQLEYEYTIYRDIKDYTDVDNLYVKGVYKPIGQRVKSIASELEENGRTYYRDTAVGKSYYYDVDEDYYLSNTSGFTFESSGWPKKGSAISKADFIEYVNAGKLYTRNIPGITSLYIKYQGGMYPYMAIYNYISKDGETSNADSIYHYTKVVDAADPQNPTYEPITTYTPTISLETKVGSYTLSAASQTAYENAVNTLNTRLNILEDLYELRETQGRIADSEFSDIRAAALADTFDGTNLWMYCQGAFMLLGTSDMTRAQQQARIQISIDKIQEMVDKAEVALNMATSFDYQLFADYIVENNYKRNGLGGTPTLQNAYIYDSTELYSLKDICACVNLKPLYYNTVATETEGVGARRYLQTFDLNTDGTKLAHINNKAIIYYYAYSNFYDDSLEDHSYWYWNRDVFDAPQSLNFWFDFLTGDDELRQFTTQAIGDRPKAVNENTVKSIYYRDTPKIIFTDAEKLASEEKKTGYNYFVIPTGFENMFSISSQGIDAKNRIDELIYQYSYCTESVTLSSIPIYYLDVNKRIHVYDDQSGIDGDYVVSKITFPLQYNGMMSITATKAPENSVSEREE